jgi:uncharacterized membrane protein
MSNKNRGKQQYQPVKNPNSIQSATAVAVQYQEASSYSGPLPQPEDLQKYEQACPGAADRIIVMAEKQAAHRQELERDIQFLNHKIVASSSRNSLLGVISAFLLCAMAIGAAVLLALNDKTVAGTIIGAVGLSSLVGTFIYGTRANKSTENSDDMNN